MIDLSNIFQQLINGLTLGATYGLIAIGYTLVYGILGMINFAHGDIYMISAYLTAICLATCTFFGVNALSVSLGITFIFALLMTGLYGFALERIAYRPLRHSTRLAPLISAIGMSLVLENFVRITQGARDQALPVILSGEIILGKGSHLVQISYLQLAIIIATVISMTLLSFIITKTTFGRTMRAIQLDMSMAQILGVNANQIIPMVFVIGAMMAAIAGTLTSLYYGSFDFSIGFIIGIKAFTSAVLGGIGSMVGAMLGGLLLGLAESLFSGFISVDYKDVFAFIVLILVLIFKPTGLLGTKEIEKV
ncbi:MAG: branched-chain amino acid ABC transporter permease LivH [Candidatus Berkiellales bacterium]